MCASLLGLVLLIGAWLTALENELDWYWLLILGIPIPLLLGIIISSLWRRRQRGKGVSQGEQSKQRGALTANDAEELCFPWRPEGEEIEEREEKRLSLLVLQDFYATQVYKGRQDPPHDHCEMVTALIDSLLQRIQTYGTCCQAVIKEKCVGVGSMYEGWGISRGDQVPIYDVMVIISPPDGVFLDIELDPNLNESSAANRPKWDSSLSQHPSSTPQPKQCGLARVCVRADPAQTRLRSFSSRSRLVDFIDRAQAVRLKEGLDYMLEECLMIGQNMEPMRMLCWLGAALRRAWMFRGGLKVSFWGREWPCVMRVQNPSGRVLYINVIPAVRIPESDVCVVARGPVCPPWQEFWEPWFCSDEGYFLRSATCSLPADNCHLLCLEILTFLNRPVSPFSTRVATFLSSYHLKTILLHLLHTKTDPQDWEGPCLAERLQDMVLMLQRCLAERQLLSFWVGNAELGERQSQPFRLALPLNLFGLLATHNSWHGLAMLEFKRLQTRLRDLPHSDSLGCLVPREELSLQAAPVCLPMAANTLVGHYRKRVRGQRAVSKKLSLASEQSFIPAQGLLF